MAHPSSSHRDNDRDTTTHRHRTSSSAHHHHRTISSTTLLLVLSLILAVLAVMLSLPSRHSAAAGLKSAAAAASNVATEDPNGDHVGTSAGFWGYLTPKRSHALVSRESNVAIREAEVARREAELLTGAPGGIAVCPPCMMEEDLAPSMSLVARAAPPPPPAPATTTIVEVDSAAPAWLKERMDGIVDREMKISNREKDVGMREESIGKREADATKREAWIMEQLLHLQPAETVEEEYVYEQEHPRHYYGEARRASPPKVEIPVELPTSTVTHVSTVIHTQTVLPPPANTRVAAHPTPETYVEAPTGVHPGRTKEVFIEVPEPTQEVVEEEDYEEEIYLSRPRVRATKKKWFGAPRW